MASVSSPRLALPLWTLIERAQQTGIGRDSAIRAIQDHLYDGGERDPALLVALARLIYEDAATVMVSRIRDASERSLALVDEAIAGAGDPDGSLGDMRVALVRSLEAERAREARLRRTVARRRPRATELMELAHLMMMRGEDDALAAELMELADHLDEVDEPRERLH